MSNVREWINIGIRFVTSGFVEAFTGAATDRLISGMNGGRMKKLGVKAGGFLIGMYAGDKIGDYIIEEVDEIVSNLSPEEEEDDDDQ